MSEPPKADPATPVSQPVHITSTGAPTGNAGGDIEAPNSYTGEPREDMSLASTLRGNAQLPPMRWPVDGRVKILGEFGRHRSKGGMGPSHTHAGLDIGGRTRTPIMSVAGGEVVFADFGTRANGYNGYGNTVVVRHDNGLLSLYAHLDSINTTVGTRVRQGEIIGRMGNTGRSIGVHLHFEIRRPDPLRRGRYHCLDPRSLLPRLS